MRTQTSASRTACIRQISGLHTVKSTARHLRRRLTVSMPVSVRRLRRGLTAVRIVPLIFRFRERDFSDYLAVPAVAAVAVPVRAL